MTVVDAAGICRHKRVEWQWETLSYKHESAQRGTPVCYDCRLALMPSMDLTDFVDFLVRFRRIYMPRRYGSWIDQFTSPSRPEASSQ